MKNMTFGLTDVISLPFRLNIYNNITEFTVMGFNVNSIFFCKRIHVDTMNKFRFLILKSYMEICDQSFDVPNPIYVLLFGCVEMEI